MQFCEWNFTELYLSFFLRSMVIYLKYGEQALPKTVKIVTLFYLRVIEIELSTEDLFKR